MPVSKAKVLCIGVITMDTVALVDKYPSEDERVIAERIARGGGGPAAVAAVALARLGIPTAIAGTIGDDADGREILEIFKREGVDTSGISIGTTATAGSVIVASREHSARAISTRQPVQQAPINQAAKELAQGAEWIHCDHVGINRLEELGVKRGSGPKISFDAGYGVEKFDASLVDLFVPTDRQMALRYPTLSLEEAMKSDAMKSSNIVVATCGSEGSAAYSYQYYTAPGFSIDVVSTLGAGDVFHGALLAQVVEGRPMAEALTRSNAVAALSCRGLDAQSAIPTRSELDTYLEAQS
jgi:sulfofructose kinase